MEFMVTIQQVPRIMESFFIQSIATRTKVNPGLKQLMTKFKLRFQMLGDPKEAIYIGLYSRMDLERICKEKQMNIDDIFVEDIDGVGLYLANFHCMTTEAYQAYKKLPSLLIKAYNPPFSDVNLVKIKSRFVTIKAESSNRIKICHEYDFPCYTQVSLCVDDIESKDWSLVMLYTPGCDIVSRKVLFYALRLQPSQDNLLSISNQSQILSGIPPM